jgi:hypothetical protein
MAQVYNPKTGRYEDVVVPLPGVTPDPAAGTEPTRREQQVSTPGYQSSEDIGKGRGPSRGTLVRRGQAASLETAEELGAERAGYKTREGPTQARDFVGDVASATAAQARGGEEEARRQMALADALTEQAAGRGPSLAALQARQGADAATRQALALAATGRGNVGAALAGAQQAAGQATTEAAGQAMQGRIQEQISAREQLAGVLAESRGADIQQSIANADLATKVAQGNQEAINSMTQQRNELAQRAAAGDQEAAIQMAALDDAARKALLDAETQRLGGVTGVSVPPPQPSTFEKWGIPILQGAAGVGAAYAGKP